MFVIVSSYSTLKLLLIFPCVGHIIMGAIKMRHFALDYNFRVSW